MIFVTTGTQLPFDRFIKIIDEIAQFVQEPIIAQMIKDSYQPKNIETFNFIAPDEFERFMVDARLIVSHAGMGSIITAIKYRKPIIIFPRLASLKEHRNDHQIATAMKMNELGYTYTAYDKKQLKDLILQTDLKLLKTIKDAASDNFIQSILNRIS
jgi:UDP-N-acetylglucosamine transferase subunit ALG13